jgi:hypothetical protein
MAIKGIGRLSNQSPTDLPLLLSPARRSKHELVVAHLFGDLLARPANVYREIIELRKSVSHGENCLRIVIELAGPGL